MSLSVAIKKRYRDFTLDVNFDTDQDRLGLLGASGCGKSMTLKCIAGIERPDEGRIVINNRVLYDSKEKVNVTPQKRNVGYLFQNYALFPNMTVEENIGCGLKCGKKEKQIIIDNKLELLRIGDLKKRYPGQLSGGQQQRVALARILAYEPELLMLDEPFSALDYYLKDQLQQELLETLEFYQGNIIMVTHSRDEVYRFCEKMVVVDNGKVLVTGGTKDLFKDPKKLAAARLTGCKNISKINRIAKDLIYASDWGVTIHTKRKIPDNCNYIGIRAHDLRAGDRNKSNSFSCQQLKLLEGPFENNMILKLKGEEALIWKVSKAYWKDSLRNKAPQMLHFPEDTLMFLSE